MAAGPITVKGKFATIESDASDNTITFGPGADAAFIACKSGGPIFVSLEPGTVQVDGLQGGGVLKLDNGDSAPIPPGTRSMKHHATGGAGVLWYTPATLEE
jgi:hypothetical protein